MDSSGCGVSCGVRCGMSWGVGRGGKRKREETGHRTGRTVTVKYQNSIGSSMESTAARPRSRGRRGFFRTVGTPWKPVIA